MNQSTQKPMANPSLILERHPLDIPGSIKIMLGRSASEILEAHGETFLAVISHPDCTSPPESAGRLILTCLPCAKDALNGATQVALGKATARPIRRDSKPTSAPPPLDPPARP